MLYTRKGDNGTSGLFGTKERLPKNSLVYEALGALDELNSLLGVCRAHSTDVRGDIAITDEIRGIQECLFIVQAELAGAPKSIQPEHITKMEGTIDKIETLIEKPQGFIISGATELSALLDYARAISRRIERRVLDAQATRAVSPTSCAYLNRLSSLLYALARLASAAEGAKESSPSYR